MGIILASSSPRRKKILQKLGYNFIIKVPNINEDNTSKLNPIDYVIDDNENFIVINKPTGIPVQSGTKSFKNINPPIKTSSLAAI